MITLNLYIEANVVLKRQSLIFEATHAKWICRNNRSLKIRINFDQDKVAFFASPGRASWVPGATAPLQADSCE